MKYGCGTDETIIAEYLYTHFEKGIKQKKFRFNFRLDRRVYRLKRSYWKI